MGRFPLEKSKHANSSKDPREYLPFLQKLQAMPELRRQYEIDNHLGRVRKALKSLHALHAHDELKLYAIKHTLYSDALELYKYQPELLRDMSQLYADYLYDQSNYKEAAISMPTPLLAQRITTSGINLIN